MSLYRKTRKDRIRNCPEDLQIRLQELLHKTNFQTAYYIIEDMEKHFSNMDITYDTIVSSIIALMDDTSYVRKGYFWSDIPFHGFMLTRTEKINATFLYAHTHFVLDNEDYGKSFNDVTRHSTKRNIYKNTFEITNDNFGLSNFALELSKDQTLFAGHTIWRVQEHIPYVDINSQLLVNSSTFTFVENNNRVDQ